MANTVASTAEDFMKAAPTAQDLSNAGTGSGVLKIGMIGCGRIGRCHAANIARLPNAKLVCVADFFPEMAVKAAAQFDVPMACKDHMDVINHAGVDAILVCSPSDTHAGIIRDASKAGKHIFCEKPVDKTLAMVDQIAKEVAASGVKFFLGFQRRYDPNFRAVKAAREEGKLGDIIKVHLVSRDPAPPPIGYLKQSGGIFSDQASHDFDMARFLVGSDITEISAMGMAYDKEIGEIGDLDHTLITLKFANGAFGTIDNSRSSKMGYDQRAELFGTAGSMFVGNVKPTTITAANESGVTTNNPEPFFMERYAVAYLEEMKEFVTCCLEDKEVPCGIADGRKPMLYSLAAWKSIKENRPVKIEEVEVNGV